MVTGLATVNVALADTHVADATGSQCPSSNPTATAVQDTALDNLFQNYGNLGTGRSWTGGDGTTSVALPDGRELWIFDDSMLGTVTNGLRDYAKSPFLHNALVVEDHGVLTKTYYTETTTRPTSYVNPVIRHPYKFAFWPGASVVNGNTLQALGTEVRFRKDGTTVPMRLELATFKLPSLARLGLRPMPSFGVDWPGGILTDGAYTYLYGNSANGIYAARVTGTDLSSPWMYSDGSGWTADFAQAVPVEHITTLSRFSVSKVGSLYVLIARPAYSNEIVGAFGCSPVGPFGPPQNIYAPPEPSAYPQSYGVLTYSAHAHPELSNDPNTIVVSYDVNPMGTQGLKIPDASIYRPRFIDVTVR